MTPAQVKPTISPELLNHIDVRVGTIESVSNVVSSEKLLALQVNFGDHKRTVLAGMKRDRANPREIEGKSVIRREPSAMQDGGIGIRGDVIRHRLCGRHYPGAGGAGNACA